MKKFVVQIGFFFFTDVSSLSRVHISSTTSHPGLALSFPGNRTVVRASGPAPQMYGCRGDVGVTGTVEGRSRRRGWVVVEEGVIQGVIRGVIQSRRRDLLTSHACRNDQEENKRVPVTLNAS
jgi:hypothetical protein